MEIAEIPRTLVSTGLRGLRLPVEVVERAARVAGVDLDERWPPLVAYESFEGEAKRFAGTLIRDGELVEEGLRQRAKAAELRRSARLHAVAEGTRAKADAELRRREEAAAEQLRAVEEAATSAEQEIDKERRQAHDKVRKQEARARQAAEEADAERQEIAADAERAARRKEIVEETKALQSELEASELEAQAEALAASEERVRELRRHGS
jgi:colicin import membrane protein